MQKQNHNVPMKPSNAPLENSNKTKQIAYLVRQSYDIFNKFGRDPEELANLTKAFVIDLKGFTVNQIGQAFTQWRQNNSAMPVPNDILKIANKIKNDEVKKKGAMSWTDFQQHIGEGWNEYKKHLKEHGARSHNLINTV